MTKRYLILVDLELSVNDEYSLSVEDVYYDFIDAESESEALSLAKKIVVKSLIPGFLVPNIKEFYVKVVLIYDKISHAGRIR